DHPEPGQPPCPPEGGVWQGHFRSWLGSGGAEECEGAHAGKDPTCHDATTPCPGCPHQGSYCPFAGRCYESDGEEDELIPAPKEVCPSGATEEQEYEPIPPPKPVCPCPGCEDGCEDCCKPCPKGKPSGCCPEGCDKCPKAGEKSKSGPRIDTLEFRPTDA